MASSELPGDRDDLATMLADVRAAHRDIDDIYKFADHLCATATYYDGGPAPGPIAVPVATKGNDAAAAYEAQLIEKHGSVAAAGAGARAHLSKLRAGTAGRSADAE